MSKKIRIYLDTSVISYLEQNEKAEKMKISDKKKIEEMKELKGTSKNYLKKFEKNFFR